MSEVPIQENKVINLVNSGIIFIADWLEKGGETWLRANAPFLNWPVLSFLFSHALNWIKEQAAKLVEGGAAIVVIGFQTAIEKKSFEDAFKNYKEKPDNEEALKKLKQSFDRAIRFDGATLPK